MAQAAMLEEEIEHPVKVLIVGNGAVGKSSMIQRYWYVLVTCLLPRYPTQSIFMYTCTICFKLYAHRTRTRTRTVMVIWLFCIMKWDHPPKISCLLH